MHNKIKRLINRQKRVVTAILMATIFAVGAQSAKTYFVAVGLCNYDSGKGSLPCSINDAQAICQFFKDYNGSDVFMLKDSNATRDHILRVLMNQFSKSGPEDEIVFAYSGHGFDGGITCYDTRNVVFCSEIQAIMRKCKARRKVMFINSCHSGSFSKKYTNDPRTNYQSGQSDVMLFLSSRAQESSWEMRTMKTSFFFNRVLEGLKGRADRNGDRKVTARELFNYVYPAVISDTNGMQHPQMYGKFSDDMVVVYVK